MNNIFDRLVVSNTLAMILSFLILACTTSYLIFLKKGSSFDRNICKLLIFCSALFLGLTLINSVLFSNEQFKLGSLAGYVTGCITALTLISFLLYCLRKKIIILKEFAFLLLVAILTGGTVFYLVLNFIRN